MADERDFNLDRVLLVMEILDIDGHEGVRKMWKYKEGTPEHIACEWIATRYEELVKELSELHPPKNQTRDWIAWWAGTQAKQEWLLKVMIGKSCIGKVCSRCLIPYAGRSICKCHKITSDKGLTDVNG